MKLYSILIALLSFQFLNAQTTNESKIDYPAFETLTQTVAAYRTGRLISIEQFNQFSSEENTLILDTRSKAAYDAIHLLGAVHLNFSDFSTSALAAVIPDKNTRILIYCNNNFESELSSMVIKSTPLALNIPTFINLYGYGYKNVYELRDYLSITDPRLIFVSNGQ